MTDSYLKSLLIRVVYPLVIISGVYAHLQLVAQGVNLQIATYIPVLLGAVVIALLEWLLPYHDEWHPSKQDVKADVLYMLLVQILLPRLLGFLIAITLLAYFVTDDSVLSNLWVHDWPIGIQAILMVLIADFLRYWIHRAAHQYSFLWRLHAVHHSTDKLYWMNTGRFHPIEKALQFVFDALPFILLSVKAEVLSLYFVFYALNGFFQHSNIELRFGVLNYIFSTAELHRWHHSKSIEESSTNYGNNTIVWDLLFGSWFLPKEKQVRELGLFNPQYPMSFADQLKTPFTVGLDKRPIAILNLKEVWKNVITMMTLQLARVFYWWPFRRAARKPLLKQQRVLQHIIQMQCNTKFGKSHHFNTITDITSFKKQVPIQSYSTLRSYIEKQIAGQHALTKEQPLFYARTSGTTGDPKYIPVLSETIKEQQRSLAIFSYLQYRAQPQAFSGKLLAIPGPYEEGTFDSGVSFGSISGLMYTSMPRHLKDKYVIPASVFSLEDYNLKYRLILRLTLPYTNLSYLASANPTTFKKLLDELNSGWDTLLNDLTSGGFHDLDTLPDTVRDDVRSLLMAYPQRAQELKALISSPKTLTFNDVWPNIRLVVTWMGGSCGIAINHIKPAFPKETTFIDLGYLSSEMRGTITLDASSNGGLPTLMDHFFEFTEVNQYEEGSRETLTIDELEEGKQYFIMVTTSAGLYRYFMNDIVEVTGKYKETPLLSFVQKGKGVTNITGEKLSEKQLIMSLEAIQEKYKIDIPFYVALACVEQARYLLYVEMKSAYKAIPELVDEIEFYLCKHNVEYASKRESVRLNPIEVKRIKPGTAEVYKRFCIEKGQRESQFKPLLLQYQLDNTFPFDSHLI